MTRTMEEVGGREVWEVISGSGAWWWRGGRGWEGERCWWYWWRGLAGGCNDDEVAEAANAAAVAWLLATSRSFNSLISFLAFYNSTSFPLTPSISFCLLVCSDSSRFSRVVEYMHKSCFCWGVRIRLNCTPRFFSSLGFIASLWKTVLMSVYCLVQLAVAFADSVIEPEAPGSPCPFCVLAELSYMLE